MTGVTMIEPGTLSPNPTHKAIDEIVAHERRLASKSQGNPSTAISRAAYAAGRVAERSPGDGHSLVTDLATVLGVEIADYAAPVVDGVGFVKERVIDDEHRQRLGYGQLPNGLLVRVEDSVGPLLPEHSSVDIGFKVAGQVMHIVTSRPDIIPSDLRHNLGIRVKDRSLLLPSQLPQDTVVCLSSVISFTHELTVQFLETNNQANGTESIR